ncbi:MAG: hypothetical protein Q9187_002387 [Circinaria calcarea]
MGDTIIDLKKAFLNNQIRILNAPLEPPRNWRNNAPAAQQGELKEKTVQEVIHKLNSIVRHHNRTVYSSQTIRHVAEQIDRLYWVSGEPDVHTGAAEDGLVGREVDLRDADVIASLPDEWPQDISQEDSQLEAFAESARYKKLHARLTALAEKRQAQERKSAQYKQFQHLLEPFKDPLVNIQPNLVTEDGELQRELEKMKVLMARVSEKVSGLPDPRRVEGEEVEMSEEAKLEAILERPPPVTST